MPMKAAVMEPRLGGRWYELAEDGTETNVGKIIVWEPPHRFVMTWDINSQWKPDTTIGSEIEVKFIPDGANATRVELEHRKFEQMGAEQGETMRNAVDGGWPGMLERFQNRSRNALTLKRAPRAPKAGNLVRCTAAATGTCFRGKSQRQSTKFSPESG